MRKDQLLPMTHYTQMRRVIFLFVLASLLSFNHAAKDFTLQGMITCANIAPETMSKNNITSTQTAVHPESDSELPAKSVATTCTDKKVLGFSRLRHLFAWTRQKKVGKRVTKPTIAFSNKLNEKLEEARRMFLDRMAAVSFTLINQENDASMNNGTLFEIDGDDDDITPQSDLCLPNRSIYVVTTAALPWRTGTSINPLLRAAYLARRAKVNSNNRMLLDEQFSEDLRSTNSTSQQQTVTLVIPWLELEEDRLELYGSDKKIADVKEQEQYIRDWLRSEAKMEDIADSETGLRIIFYPARYHSGLKSIFAMGDICAVLRNHTDGDRLQDAVCILEEPEHLNWYRAPGEGWTKVFNFVVGIVHTNYIEYAGTQFHGLWTVSGTLIISVRRIPILIINYVSDMLPGSGNSSNVVSYDKSLLP